MTIHRDPTASTETAARQLLHACPAVDLHTDTIAAVLSGVDLFGPSTAHAHPRALSAGGFGDVVYAAWIPPHLTGDRAWERAERMITGVIDVAAAAADHDVPVRFWPALEDARCLFGHTDRVDQLGEWGVRYVTLTWNNGNRFATSCEDPRPGGLTDDGKRLVEQLDSLGIVVDLSHASDATCLDVLDVARHAPLASHSSSRALRRHARNVSDDIAGKIVDAGGVIGVNVFPFFLHDTYREAALEHVVAHIEHLWSVVGDEGVAFGSDFDGIPDTPHGLVDATEFPRLVGELLDRGHSVPRVERFVRHNAVRALSLASLS